MIGQERGSFAMVKDRHRETRDLESGFGHTKSMELEIDTITGSASNSKK